MSAFVFAGPPTAIGRRNDWRLYPCSFQPDDDNLDYETAQNSFASSHWPGGRGLIGDGDVDVGVLDGDTWSQEELGDSSGGSSRFGFTGITRDQYGSALPGCTVKLFRTSDDQLIDTATSDPTTGQFLVGSPYYPDEHWIYTRKAGSPDVQGVSVNTLIGT